MPPASEMFCTDRCSAELDSIKRIASQALNLGREDSGEREQTEPPGKELRHQGRQGELAIRQVRILRMRNRSEDRRAKANMSSPAAFQFIPLRTAA